MTIDVILIGAGCRGTIYTDIMADMPEKYNVVGVAEPIESRREYIKSKHNIPDEMCCADWRELLAKEKKAGLAVIATMDKDHFGPVMEAISQGYDLLLEKPITPNPKECKMIADVAEKKGVKVVICTVLRYTTLFGKLKSIIDSGAIGKIMSVNHEECVGNVHQSHSFVRGNWGNEDRSSSMLLQKSCHDIDLLQWLIGKKCKSVQSFGSRSYFVGENAPENSPEYCIEGCPVGDSCPYNAVKLYLDDKENSWFRTASTREANPDDEMVKKAISTTQYGKCVYKCDNNVVDHQTVNMLFEDDITVTFTMSAFTKGGRFIHIMGTKGEIRAAIADNDPIQIYNFETKETTLIPQEGTDGIAGGHGGGDQGIIVDLYDYLVGTYKGVSIPEIRESATNHLTVFAAEKSRKENIVVNVDEFLKTI